MGKTLEKDWDRYAKILAMRAEGKTTIEIGRILDITSQRVCQILGRTGWVKKRKEKLPKAPEKTFEEKFWGNYTVSENGCWEWSGVTAPYGRVRFNGKISLVHRVSWILTNGPIPEGMYVCHHCDNPPCMNPEHLFLGDAADNAWDRERKHRSFKTLKNSTGRMAKLNENDVIFVRKAYGRGLATVKDLSRCYSVSCQNIWKILSGKTWKHLLPQV